MEPGKYLIGAYKKGSRLIAEKNLPKSVSLDV